MGAPSTVGGIGPRPKHRTTWAQ